MNFEQNNSDIWVFLSHSNKDYELVREVRNKMEEQGMRPLMFFLKCLDDEPEIFDLLKREIDVRPRFILCDSKNAQASEWVQKEVEYIKSKNRQYLTIDLSKPESFAEKVSEMKRRSQVFLSYASSDKNIANRISKVLQKNGFCVYDCQNLNAGTNLREQIEGPIRYVCENGYFVPILTDSYKGSGWGQMELEYAIQYEGRILPFIDAKSRYSGKSIEWAVEEMNTPLGIIERKLPSPMDPASPFFDLNSLDEEINKFCDWLIHEDLKRNG